MDKQDTILTSLQVRVLDALFSGEWFRDHFYLTGGTALSGYYYYHRYSDDLDFFSHGIDLTPIPGLMNQLARDLKVPVRGIQTSPSFQRYLVDETLQVDIVADVGYRVGSPQLIGSAMVDSLHNIAVNKVTAILGRLDTKDYVDLYLLMKRESYDIFDLIAEGKNKDGGLETFVWASVVADVQRLSLMPRMIEEISLDEIRAFYLKLRDEILDQINPGR